MKTRIYVGNLAYAATAIDIRRLFSPFGEVAAAHVFTDGLNRFAFVLMTSEIDAESAIEELNGAEFFGRELRISWANKQRPVRFQGGCWFPADGFIVLNHALYPHNRT